MLLKIGRSGRMSCAPLSDSRSLCSYLVSRSLRLSFLVSMAEGFHPFPFRTRKLSPPAPTVLHGSLCGRIGRCQGNLVKPRGNPGLFCVHHAAPALMLGQWRSIRGHSLRPSRFTCLTPPVEAMKAAGTALLPLCLASRSLSPCGSPTAGLWRGNNIWPLSGYARGARDENETRA